MPATDEKLTLTGVSRPAAVKLLRDGAPLKPTFADGVVTVDLPAGSAR